MSASRSIAVNSSSTTIGSSASVYGTGAFWEQLWRSSGLQFVGFFIVTSLIYGYQPQVGASPEALAAFYHGERTRVLVAAIFSGLNLLNLLWFAAALRTSLTETGQDGWGAAATAASTAFAALTILQISLGAALAYSIGGPANQTLISGLNDLSWVLAVLISFPRAMLIMSGVFGFWRAGLISNAVFAVGVVGVVLGVLGGTTWLSGGVWAPAGVFSRFVSPLLLLVWVVGVSRVLLTRAPSARSAW